MRIKNKWNECNIEIFFSLLFFNSGDGIVDYFHKTNK